MNHPVQTHTQAPKHEQNRGNVCCVDAAWYIVMAEGGEACGPEGARKSAGINTTEFQVPVRGYELLHRQFPSGCIVQNLDYDGSSFDGSTRASLEREKEDSSIGVGLRAQRASRLPASELFYDAVG